MGYKVLFKKAGEPMLDETFIKPETARKWMRLVSRNGYNVVELVRAELQVGARV